MLEIMALITLIGELSLLLPLTYPDSYYFEPRNENSAAPESLREYAKVQSLGLSPGLPPEGAQLFPPLG